MSIEQLPLVIKKCFLKELEKLVSKYTPFNNYTDETVKAAMLSGKLNAPASCGLNALGFCSFR